MSEGDNWVNPEVLDNPSGEPPPPPDPEEVLAAEEAAADAPAEPAVPDGELAQDEPVDEAAREKAGILNELRETRSSMKAERMENAERNRILEERLGKMQEAWESSQQPAGPKAPDPEEDPLGAINYRQEQQSQQVQQVLDQQQQQAQQVVQQQQVQQAVQQVQAQEKAFMESSGLSEEVYEAGLDYAREEVKNYYTAMGYPADQADQMSQLEQLQFTAQAGQMGANPAEARYNLAIARGYKPAEGAPVAAAGVSPADPGATAAKMLDFKKGAVESSKSLGTTGGAVGKRRITLDELGEMPNDVFDKITKDPALFEKISVEGSLLI